MDEEAKEILYNMAEERLKLSSRLSLLTKHTGSFACKAKIAVKRELFNLKLQLKVFSECDGCEDYDQQTVRQQQDPPHAPQMTRCEQTPVVVTSTNDALKKCASSYSQDIILDASDIEMVENFGQQWHLFDSKNVEDTQGDVYISPSICAESGETKNLCAKVSEEVTDDLNLFGMDPQLTDFCDLQDKFPASLNESISSETFFKLQNKLNVLPAEGVYTSNSEFPLQQKKLDLCDFEVQLKHPNCLHDPQVQDNKGTSLAKDVHQIQTRAYSTITDQLYESSLFNVDNTNIMDYNLHVTPRNNEQTYSPHPPSLGLNLKCAVQDEKYVSCIKKQSEGRVELDSNKETTCCSGNDLILDHGASCWEDTISSTKLSAKTEEDFYQFEPALENLSDLLDLNQEKQNLLLQEEMHQLYVQSEQSPEPYLLASRIATESAEKFHTPNESRHDKFLQLIDADLDSYNGNLSTSSGLQLDVDFYTQSFDDYMAAF